MTRVKAFPVEPKTTSHGSKNIIIMMAVPIFTSRGPAGKCNVPLIPAYCSHKENDPPLNNRHIKDFRGGLYVRHDLLQAWGPVYLWSEAVELRLAGGKTISTKLAMNSLCNPRTDEPRNWSPAASADAWSCSRPSHSRRKCVAHIYYAINYLMKALMKRADTMTVVALTLNGSQNGVIPQR